MTQSVCGYLAFLGNQSEIRPHQLKSSIKRAFFSFSLHSIIRFHDSALLFHDQEADGLIRMCNMYMNFKYKTYQAEGYKAIKKQPAIYISEASKYANIEYRELVTVQVGLVFAFNLSAK